MKGQDVTLKKFCGQCEQLVELDVEDIPKLPHPYEDWVDEPITEVSEAKRAEVETSLDGVVGVRIPVPETEAEKEELVAKFLSGQPQEFNVTGLDIPFNNPVSIFTAPNEEVQHIYVTDAGNQRIVQLNKDGSFVRQFRPRVGEPVTFANLQDVYVDEIGGRLYILDSNNLYLANLPEEGAQPEAQ